VATLRLDSAGIGDSDGPSMGWEQEPLLYAPERLTEVRIALDALEQRGLPPRFVLGGLCSGANWAFHTAIEDPRVQGAILLNPRALFWNRWMRQGRDERVTQAITERSTWRRIVRGEIPLRRLVAALGGLLRHVLVAPLRGRRGAQAADADRLGRALERLAASDTRLLVVFTDREPLRDRMAADGELERLTDAPGVRVEVVPTAAEMHTLPALWLQRRVNALLDDALATYVTREVREPAA
jgi:hypothetical protein